MTPRSCFDLKNGWALYQISVALFANRSQARTGFFVPGCYSPWSLVLVAGPAEVMPMTSGDHWFETMSPNGTPPPVRS